MINALCIYIEREAYIMQKNESMMIILSGGIIGIIASCLVHFGNPMNMGFCIACFLREQGSGSKKRLESYFEQINLSEKSLNIIARLNDQESIKKLVASGLGISFISAKAITDADNLLTIKLPENSLTRSLYFAYHKDYILKEHILSFIKFVQNFYAKK